MAITMYQYMKQGKSYTFSQLTAPGSTDSLFIGNCSSICFQYVIASINTSVTVRIEGSLDNSNWFNLDIEDGDTDQVANGTYSFYFEGEVSYARFTFVSEAGGTAATIDVVAYAGGLS